MIKDIKTLHQQYTQGRNIVTIIDELTELYNMATIQVEFAKIRGLGFLAFSNKSRQKKLSDIINTLSEEYNIPIKEVNVDDCGDIIYKALIVDMEDF